VPVTRNSKLFTGMIPPSAGTVRAVVEVQVRRYSEGAVVARVATVTPGGSNLPPSGLLQRLTHSDVWRDRCRFVYLVNVGITDLNGKVGPAASRDRL
jgi:hypothetical protein